MSLKTVSNSLSIWWKTFSPPHWIILTLNYTGTTCWSNMKKFKSGTLGYIYFYFNSHLSSSRTNKNLFIPIEPEKMHFLLIHSVRLPTSITFHLRLLGIFNDPFLESIWYPQPSISYCIFHCVFFVSLYCRLKNIWLMNKFCIRDLFVGRWEEGWLA